MKDEVEDDVKDFETELSDEKVDEPEVDLPNEDDEGTKEDSEEDQESLEGTDEEDKKNETSIEIPQFKTIVKKYPDLFKDFPHLRHAFFHAKEYKEIFPTVEEAKEAASDIENLRGIEEAISSGKSEGIIKFIDTIKGLGEDVVPQFAANFLPSIKKANQDLYYQVMTPELVNFTRSLYNAGLRNENDNMKNAALVVAHHFFGDQKVATGEKEVKSGIEPKETKKDNELEKERQSFRQERYSVFYNDVVTSSDSKIEQLVSKDIDPKGTLSEGMKELIVEKVMKEISKTLSSNSLHVNKMNSLWKKAGADNFSNQHRSKIISAYIEAATEIIPKIRSKVRTSVLGIRERSPENQSRSHESERRIEPRSTTGGGRQSTGIDPKKVDWKKTSDVDFLRGNVTLKQ